MHNFSQTVKIGNRILGNDGRVFIIAEAGVNHNGDLEKAMRMVDIAADAGVDAIKFQAFHTENLILRQVRKADYQRKTSAAEESQYDMLKHLEMGIRQSQEIKEYCSSKGILFLTTPFDERSLDELDSLDMEAYKIASTDLTNLPFLRRVARKGKPIFLSTGMSYLEEVELALHEIGKVNKDVVLLQCTANYPASDDEANLNVLDLYRERYQMLLGYSDHTVGIGAAPYAIAKGAVVLEKHFTLDKGMKGPDHRASLSPQELVGFVQEVRRAECFMGKTLKYPTFSEIRNRAALQKCFVAKRIISVGEYFTEENIVAKRTGGKGISPIYEKVLWGTKANRTYDVDEIIEF